MGSSLQENIDQQQEGPTGVYDPQEEDRLSLGKVNADICHMMLFEFQTGSQGLLIIYIDTQGQV